MSGQTKRDEICSSVVLGYTVVFELATNGKHEILHQGPL